MFASCIQCISRLPYLINFLSSSLNIFDDGAVLLRSILWTLSIVSVFCNHNVSRDGSEPDDEGRSHPSKRCDYKT
jgi:hypothetical protein